MDKKTSQEDRFEAVMKLFFTKKWLFYKSKKDVNYQVGLEVFIEELNYLE